MTYIEDALEQDVEQLSEHGTDRMFHNLSVVFRNLFLLLERVVNPMQADELVSHFCITRLTTPDLPSYTAVLWLVDCIPQAHYNAMSLLVLHTTPMCQAQQLAFVLSFLCSALDAVVALCGHVCLLMT